jgi:hypothetical protein
MNAAVNEGSDSIVEAEIKPKAKAKKAQHDDLIVSIVAEIGGLDAEGALKAVPALLDGAEENYFKLGGVLSFIHSNKFWKTLEQFKDSNFKEFVEAEYGIHYRRAMVWIEIYDKLVESGVPWSKIQHVGWTKIRDLAKILTADNVDEWVHRALNSTVMQLQDLIAKAMAGTLPNSGLTPTDDHKSEVTTFTVKVHSEQKVTINLAIEKAKVEAGTEYAGVALDSICNNYLTGGNVTKPASLLDVMKKYSPEELLGAMEEALPEFIISAKLKTGAKAP